MTVWVTGLGCVSSAGWGVEDTWSAVVRGRSCISWIKRFPLYEAGCRVGGPVPGLEDGVADDEALALRFGSAAAAEALRDAAIPPGEIDMVVTGNHGERRLPAGDEDPVIMTPAELARRLASEVGARESLAVYGACASGGLAVGTGLELIRSGVASVVLVGGTDSMLRDYDFFQFCNLYAMSTRACEPGEACCPFDARRDGFVLSEGAAYLVLEDQDHARRRGAGPRAVLSGFGSSQNAYHIVASPPDAVGPTRAISDALRDAGIGPDDVDYVNAHGTSTRDNDWCESLALERALGERANVVPVSASKSVLGHAMAAAGALEAVISVRALETGIIPPTINLEEPDPRCRLDYVPGVARATSLKHVISNSFGFGGHNSTLVFSHA